MLLKKSISLAGKQIPGAFGTIVLSLAMLLSGCAKQAPLSSELPSEPSSNVQQELQPKEIAQTRIGSSIEAALQFVRENPVDGWTSTISYPYENSSPAYAALNNAQQALYDEMLPRVRDLTPFEYTAEKDGYDVLDNVLIASQALCRDHPEYEIYFDIEEVFDGDMTTALRASYVLPYDPNAASAAGTETIKNEVQIFEEECNLAAAAIPEDFSTYDKYRYLAVLISLRTCYDNTFTGGKPTANAYGAIEGGTSICQGYATGFEYLCRKANLWCTQVSGVSQGVSHAWNLVKLESGTYHVDVTWADADGNTPLDSGWQSYFMLTQDEILMDHEIDDGTAATGTAPLER